MAAGERDRAVSYWVEARALYKDAGVTDGVVEADHRVAALAAA
jgi:hypothetical protein